MCCICGWTTCRICFSQRTLEISTVYNIYKYYILFFLSFFLLIILIILYLLFIRWLAGGFAGVVMLLSIFFMKDSKFFIESRKEKEEKSRIEDEQSNLELAKDKEEDKPLSIVDQEMLEISISNNTTSLKQPLTDNNNNASKNNNEENGEEENDPEERISRISCNQMGTAIVYDHVTREQRNSKIEEEKQQQLQQQPKLEDKENEIKRIDNINETIKKQRDYLVDNFWFIYVLLIITCFIVIGNMTIFDVIFPLMAIDDYKLNSIYSGYIIYYL